MSELCRRSDFIECHLAVLLWRIFSILFLIVGIPGNILAIVVLSRPRMRHTTTSVYLRLLAVVDTAVLLIAIPRQMAYFYSSMKLSNHSIFLCKFFSFVTPASMTLSWCFLPFITLDRLINVKFPVWAKRYSTKRVAITVFTVLTIVLFALNVHTIMFLSISKTEKVIPSLNSTNTTIQINFECSPGSEWYGEFHGNIWPWLVFILFSIAPVTFQIVCNILLARKLKVRFRKKQARRALDDVNKQELRDMRSVTKMLLTVTVFFILSSVPQCLRLVLKSYIFLLKSPENIAKDLLFQSFVQLCMYSNNTFNFLLYTLSGRVFRKELRCIFRNAGQFFLQRLGGRAIYPLETAGSRGPTTDQKTNDYGDGQSCKEITCTKV